MRARPTQPATRLRTRSSILIAIVGPTGTGKTDLAIHLAERLGGEIVNADSRQVYRYLDIGTAKPTPEQRRRVPHHVLDVADPDEPYSLARYREDALGAIENIHARGLPAYLVGGSGQYVWALLEGWQPPAVPGDPALRAELEARAAAEGGEALFAELRRRDPGAAAFINPRNLRRVIRALEVCLATGRPFSAQRRRVPPPWRTLILGLDTRRAALARRLDARVDAMVAAGWPAEVARLLSMGYTSDLPSFASLGYRELAAHVRGEISLAEAVAQTKRSTHRFVRRQRTWFRQTDPRIHWLDAAASPLNEATNLVDQFLKQGAAPLPLEAG